MLDLEKVEQDARRIFDVIWASDSLPRKLIEARDPRDTSNIVSSSSFESEARIADQSVEGFLDAFGQARKLM